MSGADRYSEGLVGIDGEQGRKVFDSLAGVAPDLTRFIIGFLCGEIHRHEGLTPGERKLATIAGPTMAGHAQPQPKVHAQGALNVGAGLRQIVETIMQMAVHAGFPACFNAMFTARDVFGERGLLTVEEN